MNIRLRKETGRMSNKYSKWNLADTYRKRNKDVVSVFQGQEMCFFQYKATQVYSINAYIEYHHSALDNLDIEILCRIMSSHAIVMEQLYCYLYIQGLDVSYTELTQRLKVLLSKSFIRKGMVINGKEKTFLNHLYYENLEFYEIAPAGERFLKNMGISISGAKKYNDSAINISWYEYIKASIMYNQVVLKLLLNNPHIRDFCLHVVFKDKNMKEIYAPLVINTDKKMYVFEFVRGTSEGKRMLTEKYLKWRKYPKVKGREVNLVFLCENDYHMELMASHIKNIAENNSLKMYFTFDKLWFGLENEKISSFNVDERCLGHHRSLQ